MSSKHDRRRAESGSAISNKSSSDLGSVREALKYKIQFSNINVDRVR